MGGVTVTVHKKAEGRVLQGSDSKFTFTDNYSETRAYIPISRLTLADFSSQETSKGDDAIHAIDGRLSTRWHTLWDGSDKAKYITLKVDKPAYFSGIDYTPIANAGNGTLTACEVYASIDGENWYPAGSASGWARNSNVKHLTFNSPVYGQYIKIVGTSSVGGFMAARLIEVFEDRTMHGKTMSGIKLDAIPEKLEYDSGEKLDLTGLAVSCYFTDGTKISLPSALVTADCSVLEKPGTQTVNISYLYFPSVSFTVAVSENTRTATKLNVEAAPEKTSYFTGQELELKGLVVSAEDADGKWYPFDYSVKPVSLTEAGEQTVKIEYQGRKTSFKVNVSQSPEKITVKKLPDKQTYEIGEGFESEGLVLEVEYSDDTTRVLTSDSEEYCLTLDNFSALPGEKTIAVSIVDYPDVEAEIPVTVLSNLDMGEFRYDVLPSDEGGYKCYLSGYTNSTETTVSVPDKVTVNGITYQVVGVRTGTFDAASQVEELALPGSIQHIESGALTALKNLENLYLTGIADIKNLTIDDGSLPEGTSGSIFMANKDLGEELEEKLKDYESETDEEFMLTSKNLLSAGQVERMSISDPEKLVYELGEAMDFSGLEVTAELKNGIVLPLGEHQYSVGAGQNTVYGSRNITVSINGTDVNKSFKVQVLKTAPSIKIHPQDKLYKSIESAKALTAAADGDEEDFLIKWYFSSNESFSVDEDQELGSGSEYTPAKAGYYYAEIFRKDAEGNLSNPAQTMPAHIKFGDFPVVIEGRMEGYESLAEAFQNAPEGAKLVLKKDVSLSGTVSSKKKLTLKGESDKIKITRAEGFTGALFNVSAGSLSVKNLIIDGNSEAVTAAEGIFLMNGASTLTLGKGCIISNAKTQGNGSAVDIIDASDAPSLIISGAVIKNCTAASYGGAVFVYSKGSVTVNSGEFSNNKAGSLGGVICTNSYTAGKVSIKGGSFEGNSANYGGVVCIGGSSASEISGGSFKNNTAATKGSVICYYNGGNHVISGGSFDYSGNFCAEVRVGNPSITVKGGSFSTEPSYVPEGYKAIKSGAFYHVCPNDVFKGIQKDEDELTVRFSAPVSGIVVMAGYESSGRMIYCQTKRAAGSTDVSFDYTEAAKIKLFIIDEYGYIPLDESYEYTT